MTKLILFILIFIIFIRVVNLLFRGIYRMYGAHPNKRNKQNFTRKNSKKVGEINIDHMPDKKGKFGNDFKGGDYIDYEEVK